MFSFSIEVVIVIVLILIYRLKYVHTNKVLRDLFEKATRWYTLSVKDNSPALRLMHVNYAIASIENMESVASRSRIKSAVGVDVEMFKTAVMAQQDLAMLLLYSKVPDAIDADVDYKNYVKNLKNIHNTPELKSLLANENVPEEFKKVIIDEPVNEQTDESTIKQRSSRK